MKAEDTEEMFLARTKTQLDEDVDRLDAQTLSRLNRARHKALAQLERGCGLWKRWSIPIGGLASALVVVVAIGLTQPSTSRETVSNLEDLDLLSAVESFELLEDLEFYEWLSLEHETG